MKLRIKKFCKFFWLRFLILLMAFCSGCGTIGQHVMPSYPPVKSPVYIGTCGDLGEVFSKDKGEPVISRVVCCVDLPFSFVADTIYLPFDLYDHHESTMEPLKGWTFKPFPGSELPPYGHNTNHIDKVIPDDYQNFITKNSLQNEPIGGFYEDGTGQHAIEFTAFPPGENATWNYVLIYNKENKRIKVIKYKHVRYQS